MVKTVEKHDHEGLDSSEHRHMYYVGSLPSFCVTRYKENRGTATSVGRVWGAVGRLAPAEEKSVRQRMSATILDRALLLDVDGACKSGNN